MRMTGNNIDIQKPTGLVLEGGGMRCIFTVGVLDYLMDNGIWFPYTIGVSGGASNGISYASRQRGRSYYSNIELLEIHNYIGIKNFLKGHGYIDLDFLFYEYPDRYFPFDFKTYQASPDRFVVVASDCRTGKPVYFEEKQDFKRLLDESLSFRFHLFDVVQNLVVVFITQLQLFPDGRILAIDKRRKVKVFIRFAVAFVAG